MHAHVHTSGGCCQSHHAIIGALASKDHRTAEEQAAEEERQAAEAAELGEASSSSGSEAGEGAMDVMWEMWHCVVGGIACPFYLPIILFYT